MLPQISHQLATVGWQQRLVGNDNKMIQVQPHTHAFLNLLKQFLCQLCMECGKSIIVDIYLL